MVDDFFNDRFHICPLAVFGDNGQRMCGGQVCGNTGINHRADAPEIKRLIRLHFNLDTNLSPRELVGILKRNLVPPPNQGSCKQSFFIFFILCTVEKIVYAVFQPTESRRRTLFKQRHLLEISQVLSRVLRKPLPHLRRLV